MDGLGGNKQHLTEVARGSSRTPNFTDFVGDLVGDFVGEANLPSPVRGRE